MKKMNKKRGFTITELVIVISVIAILSAVLIPTFSGLVGKSKETAATSGAKNAYTEYLANFNYDEGEPADDFIYEANGKYVVIKDGQLLETVESSLLAAENELGYVKDTDLTTDGDQSSHTKVDTGVANLTAYVEK